MAVTETHPSPTSHTPVAHVDDDENLFIASFLDQGQALLARLVGVPPGGDTGLMMRTGLRTGTDVSLAFKGDNSCADNVNDLEKRPNGAVGAHAGPAGSLDV